MVADKADAARHLHQTTSTLQINDTSSICKLQIEVHHLNKSSCTLKVTRPVLQHVFLDEITVQHGS